MICPDETCTATTRHWHGPSVGSVTCCPAVGDPTPDCIQPPRCVDPRTAPEPDVEPTPPSDITCTSGQRRILWDGDEWVRAIEWQGLHERLCRAETAAESARTLRIEVTDADVAAALIAADYALASVMSESGPGVPLREDTRAMLASFAARLAARQWVRVPDGATIPAGVPTRVEHVPTGEASEYPTGRRVDWHVKPCEWTYLVPADRLGDLITTEPPKDLAARVMDWLADTHGWAKYEEGVAELRAALAAEGVDG